MNYEFIFKSECDCSEYYDSKGIQDSSTKPTFAHKPVNCPDCGKKITIKGCEKVTIDNNKIIDKVKA
jgi:hypothetical protein